MPLLQCIQHLQNKGKTLHLLVFLINNKTSVKLSLNLLMKIPLQFLLISPKRPLLPELMGLYFIPYHDYNIIVSSRSRDGAMAHIYIPTKARSRTFFFTNFMFLALHPISGSTTGVHTFTMNFTLLH